MYTRNVSLKLKANPFSASEFADILDRDIIPLLRKQKGFHEEISFIALSRVVEGTPRVETFEVANSTTQEIATRWL